MTDTTEKKVPTIVEKKESKEGGIQRHKSFFPYFSLTPHEFFTLNPFEMMKRFSEDMNNVFQGYGLWRGGYPVRRKFGHLP